MKTSNSKQPLAARALLQCFIVIVLLLTSCKKQALEVNLNKIGDTQAEGGAVGILALETVNPVGNANAAYEGFLNAFLVRSGGRTYFTDGLIDRDRAFMWQQAYMITMVCDAYDRTPTAARKQLITDLLNTFLYYETTDLSWDSWNDDVQWAIIALIRGYKITGITAFRDAAKSNFDMVWARGWDNTYGGGIWEDQAQVPSGGKCGLSNWPMIIPGCMLYEATGDVWYLNRSKEVYAWARTHNWDPATGKVWESYGPSGLHGDDNYYNTGLMVNAAASLYKITGDVLYYNDAIKAADHKMARWSVLNMNKVENGGFGADQMARGISKLTRENPALASRYNPWLLRTAIACWNNRRTDYNYTHNVFTEPTGTTGEQMSMECMGSVTTLMSIPEQQVENIGTGTFKVISRQNGYALDAVSNGTANGTLLDAWGYNGGNNQRWTLTGLGGGLYRISGVGSGRTLNVTGNSTADGAKIVLWDWQGTGNSKVYLTSPAAGYYVINFVNSGKVADVAGNTQGAAVNQWTYNGGNNQQWQFLAP